MADDTVAAIKELGHAPFDTAPGYRRRLYDFFMKE